MSWRLAESLKKLRAQINEAFPGRDKSSDGAVGDLSHSARKSDHNPDEKGIVKAIDIDEDLNGDRTLEQVITSIRASRDKRVNYIIYEGRITVQGSDLQSWKKYSGANAHSHHAHISVFSELADDTSEWSIDGTAETLAQKPSVSLPLLKRGSKGDDVTALQVKLSAKGFAFKIDGDFGSTTERIVKEFQIKNKLEPDGIVGPDVWRALG